MVDTDDDDSASVAAHYIEYSGNRLLKDVNHPLNPNLRGLEKSSTLAINEMSNQLISEGRNVFKFGLGQSPFPVPEEVVDALRQNDHQKDYLPVQGLDELRNSVVRYIHRKVGASYLPEGVIVGPGSKELIFLVQLVLDAELILPAPSWVSYIPQAKIIGRKLRLLVMPMR